jgi:hypothetical protein
MTHPSDLAVLHLRVSHVYLSAVGQCDPFPPLPHPGALGVDLSKFRCPSTPPPPGPLDLLLLLLVISLWRVFQQVISLASFRIWDWSLDYFLTDTVIENLLLP